MKTYNNVKTIRVAFNTYSAVLKKTFSHVLDFADMAQFHLYAKSLYSGNYEIVSVTAL
jgi:hypothetical protein